MSKDCGYLLVFHGSRDPRYHQESSRLTQLIQVSLGLETMVGSVWLELALNSLAEQFHYWSIQAKQKGIMILKIIPLFLLPGVHLHEDLPEAIATAKNSLDNQVDLELLPYLGSYEQLLPWLREQYQNSTQNSKEQILLAHGSRLEQAQIKVADLADRLGVNLAYWSGEPKLDQVIADFVKQGTNSLEIIPYFLFEGKITEAIALQVQEFQQQYPQLSLTVSKPLGASPALARLITAEILNEPTL